AVPGAAGLLRGGGLLAATAAAVFALALVAESRPPSEIVRPPCPERLDPLVPVCSDPWRNPRWMRIHFERAMDAVEWACETKFRDRPYVVTGDRAEVAWALARHDVVERRRNPDQELEKPAYYSRRATELIGIYLPEFDAVYINPSVMEASAKNRKEPRLTSAGVLQLALVHEAVHGLDWERFPHWEDEWDRRDGSASRAFGAIREGHAQHITRRVAMEWGMDVEWRALLRLWDDKPTDASKWAPDLRGWDSWSYRYVVGQRFLDAVHAATGHEGLTHTLMNPPAHAADLFYPDLWVRGLAGRPLMPTTDVELEPENEFLLPP
nr:hypothetical protein [Planctomycetota bacterium]